MEKWLCENKITNPVDIAFLRAEEVKFFNNLVRGQIESATIQSVNLGGVVFTQTTDLRMVHCLLEDDVKEAFLRCHDTMDRAALDSRNSPHRPKTWLEKIVDKYNLPTFCPQTKVFPDLHSNFLEPIDVSLGNCPRVVTTDQVKAWIADGKAKFVIVIDKWEQSRNGNGQRVEGNPNFGNMASIKYQVDNRATYLNGHRSSLLYYWQMLDHYDMLCETVSILPRELGVSTMMEPLSSVCKESAHRHSTSAYAKKRDSEEKERPLNLRRPVQIFVIV